MAEASRIARLRRRVEQDPASIAFPVQSGQALDRLEAWYAAVPRDIQARANPD